jgi:FkbM family methyltransferase
MSIGDRYTILRDNSSLFFQGLLDYDFTGMTKDSVVLDLGACVGGFTIRAAERCKHIYAVEPLYIDILKKNLELNHIRNCTILPYAIGEKRHKGTLEYGRKKEVEYVTFGDILSMISPGPVDFMKCDIEGAEKYVDFNRIPNIEAELHTFENGKLSKVEIYHKRKEFT